MRVTIQGLTTSYAGQRVLDDVSLDVADGELLAVLGPSGSGKSTLLHAIAGLLEPDAGTVAFGGRDVTRVPAQERGTPLVLQRHALFPHLRALDNVAFGLRMAGVPRREREERARAALADVHLEALAERYPAEMSGGEAQRVAIARALVTRPRVLLMDEPFSSLDAALRAEMQDLLLALHRSKRITIVFVTHDQREALRIGERIAILREGKLRQIGPAREVYDEPSTPETARFLGLTNILPARLRGGRVVIDAVGEFHCPRRGIGEGASVLAAFRPEHLSLRPPHEPVGVAARIARVNDHGQTVGYAVEVGDARIDAVELGPPRYAVGDDVRLVFERPPWVLPDPAASNGPRRRSSPPLPKEAP